MKDPTEKHRRVDQDDYDGYGFDPVCISDYEKWPCEKIQKWEASESYRIAQLEAQVSGLTRRLNVQGKQLDKLTENDRRTRLLLTGGIMPAFRDVADGQPVGRITIDIHRNNQRVDTAGGTFMVGLGEEYTVTYKSPTRTVVNGEETERTYVKP